MFVAVVVLVDLVALIDFAELVSVMVFTALVDLVDLVSLVDLVILEYFAALVDLVAVLNLTYGYTLNGDGL